MVDKGIDDIMTNIRITKKNRQRIRDIGSMGKTYDEVIDEILTFWEENHQ